MNKGKTLCLAVLAGCIAVNAGTVFWGEGISRIDANAAQAAGIHGGVSKSAYRPELVKASEDYANIAVSRVQGYVNIRQQPNTSSQIMGKIYNNCAATIINTVEGEDGKWYQIESGTVSGYIKAQYFITGDQAKAVAKEIGTVYATINTASLRLRAAPSLDSEILTTLTQGTEYLVLEEHNNFAKLSIDATLTGYVSMDYIKTRVEFNQAVSLTEENAQKAEEARRVQEAQQAIQKLQEVKLVETKAGESTDPAVEPSAPKATEVQTAAADPSATDSAATDPAGTIAAAATDPAGTIAANPVSHSEEPTAQAPPVKTAAAGQTAPAPLGPGYTTAALNEAPGQDGPASNAVVSATRTAIVAYAKQYLGNPYMYGGTSLTQGADCSGFVMRVFENFNIDTGRSSRDQAAKVREIAVDAVQPGDLLFYASGDYINHVGIYIGGGQIIHAGTSKTGITISPADYRTPAKAGTFLDSSD